MTRGTLFDGSVALERPIDVTAAASDLVLTDGSGSEERVAAADLILLDRRSGRVRLAHRRIDGWRLLLQEPIAPDVAALLPKRAAALSSPVSRRTMGVLIGVTGALSALAAILIFAPHLVARHLPMSLERKIGAAYDLPANLTRCDDPKAQAALDALIDRLDPTARRDGFTIELLDVDAVNAAALPGGRMVVFRGLIDELGEDDGVDGLAGVLAHEIAHVRRRHVATALVRQFGLGAVVTAAGGGAVATNAGGLLALRYGRGAEAEADRDAQAILRRAGIDPRATARQFDRFADEEIGLPEWLESHPASKGRAADFRKTHEAGKAYRPSLDAAGTTAILNACNG
jgi:Zn-dependent protease with chaperone function